MNTRPSPVTSTVGRLRKLVPAGTNVDAADDVAVIDLGVDAARAEAMAAAAGTIAVPQTAVRGVK